MTDRDIGLGLATPTFARGDKSSRPARQQASFTPAIQLQQEVSSAVYEDVINSREHVEPFLYRYAGNGAPRRREEEVAM
jgi:hypothetical protein